MNYKNLLFSFFFYLAVVLFIIGFSFTDNPVGNWYQQFMPNLGGRTITDVTFLDTLIGFSVTNNFSPSDTGYILKTTNGGDNWVINATLNRTFTKIKFINNDTGFACGGTGGGTPYIYKTTNASGSWFVLSTFGCALWRDMAVLNNDTIWVVDSDGLCGGVFLTTNGGVSWQRQLDLGSQNPAHIYMFNRNIGFVAQNTLYKTTNSGTNWFPLPGGGFFDMYFVDSLTGWGIFSNGVRKTTDGGLNWVQQTLPYGGNIMGNGASEFMNKNPDTIWAVGESIIVSGSPPTRGILFRTTNSGNNWLFQLPDTAIHINRYLFGQFASKQVGWAYSFNPTGIHTTNGGDPIFYTSVKQINSSFPKDFALGQNYPNPFNPITKFKLQISKLADVKVKVYDITGREISVVLDKKLARGEYEIAFDANELPSGVYFYSLFVDGNLIDTKKMILLK
jgi:photosystem II stability/assembly factor-like uncharacterized protein